MSAPVSDLPVAMRLRSTSHLFLAAGILAALLAQRLSPEEAMKLAVYLHGLVADRIAAEQGMIGMIASDIIDGLPAAMRSLSAAA